MSKIDNFPYSTPTPAKIWSRSTMFVSAESEKCRLISRIIIFQKFQPIWPRYQNVTDRLTDNLPWQYRALRLRSMSVKISTLQYVSYSFTYRNLHGFAQFPVDSTALVFFQFNHNLFSFNRPSHWIVMQPASLNKTCGTKIMHIFMTVGD